jgi:hypothetical protein
MKETLILQKSTSIQLVEEGKDSQEIHHIIENPLSNQFLELLSNEL